MRSGLSRTDIQDRMKELVHALFTNIPSGVGSHRKDLRVGRSRTATGSFEGGPMGR